MLTGFTIKLPNGKYFQNSQFSTSDITKARIYKNLSTLLKYAIQPKHVHKDMIDEGIHLIQVKEDDDSISVVDLGEVWACYHMYGIGFNMAKHTIVDKPKIQKAMQYLTDNGIEKNKCSAVLQELCTILLDINIEKL